MSPAEIKERAWKIAGEINVLNKSIQIALYIAQEIKPIHLVLDYTVPNKYFLSHKDLAEIYSLENNDYVICSITDCSDKNRPHFGPNHEGEWK